MIFQIRSKLFALVLFIFASVLVSGSGEVNPEISGKGHGYFVMDNIREAEHAGKVGYVDYRRNDYAEHFGLGWEKKPGVMRIIRSGPDDHDDVGYPLLLQLAAVNGIEVTLERLEIFHNISFLVVLSVIALILVKVTGKLRYGVVLFALGLLLKYCIATYVYGWPENRTLAVLFPGVMFCVFYMLGRTERLGSKIGIGVTAIIGGCAVGTIWIMRSSEGMAALLATLAVIPFLYVRLPRKILLLAFFLLGFGAVVFALPSAVSLHKDLKLGKFEKWTDYFETTGGHPIWHSVLIGLGRNKNALGMTYDDVRAYDIVREKYQDSMHPIYNIHGPQYYQALRKLFFEYLANHPLEHLLNIARATGETLYVIPYATSTGRYETWYGYLPVKEGVEIDRQHRAPAPRSLVTLRFEYLRLSLVSWLFFTTACCGVGLALIRKPRFRWTRRLLRKTGFVLTTVRARKRTTRIVNFLLGSFLTYLTLLAAVRIIVPAHGFSLVVGFWLFASLCWLDVATTWQVKMRVRPQ